MSVPTMIGFPDFNDDDNNEDDFIQKMELELANDLGGFDFISTMKEELNTELIRGIDALGSALPLSLLDNGIYLGSLDDVEDATNPQDDRHRHRQVHGNARRDTLLGIYLNRPGTPNSSCQIETEKKGQGI